MEGEDLWKKSGKLTKKQNWKSSQGTSSEESCRESRDMDRIVREGEEKVKVSYALRVHKLHLI